MNRLFYIFFALFIFSCSSKETLLDKKSFYGKYSVKEFYEIKAGTATGTKDTTNYSVIIKADNNNKVIENFANAYSVLIDINADSLFIASQKFPYQNREVNISGKGFFKGDSLFMDYFSGGPAGQIFCKWKAIKSKD